MNTEVKSHTIKPNRENFKYDAKKTIKETQVGKDLYEEIVEFDANNRVTSVSRYKNNELHGESLNYSDGLLEQKISYENGIRNGPLEIYREGMLSLYSLYNKDNLEGKTIYFYDSGIHSKILNYTDNKINGLSISFYENGSVLEIAQYKDDKKNGFYKSYHDNGQMLEFGNYKNNKKTGDFIKYYSNGVILEKQKYEMDGIMSSSKVFNINGEECIIPSHNAAQQQ